ncbi:Isopenicillin N epimerase component 1 [Colletotrichum fructicola]|nr:Isopenicillin N epimerase component 1 [Colletotrichum fructicola]
MPSPVGGGRNSSPFSLARLATQAGGASSSANPSPVRVNVHGGSSAAESPVSIGALAHQSTRTHLDTEWESMKKEIKYLYLDEDMPLQDVVSVLSKENGFHTNVRMCKTRLKRWGFTKNNSKNRKSSFRNETRPVKSRGIFKRFADRLQNQNGARFPVARSTNNVEDARSTSIFDPTFSLNHVSPFGDNTAHSAVATISELDTTSHGSSGYCEVEKMLVDELPWKGILDVSDPIPVPSYDLTCPYRFGEKRFRCIQDHDNGPTSEWDSLGFGSDINLSSPKPCTSNCMCRTLDPAYSFSFLVRMSRYGMSVKFFSDALWAEVVNALPRCHKPRGDDRMVEGQVLFECREHLTMRSQTIHSEQLSGLAQSGNQSLWLELELLLHGLFDHPAFRQHQTHARQNDQREEECSSPDTPSDVSTPRSAVSLGSSLLKSFNPWRKLRAQWKNRRGQNRLEDKINKLDEVFRNEWLQYEVSPTSSNESETIWMNGNLQVEIAEMADTSIVHHQLSSHVTTSPMQELDGSLTQRYELYSEASSSVLSNTDGSPVDEQHQMDLDTEYNTSFDGSGTEVSPLESFFDGEICELNSRELRTREEFELSKAKNTEHRPFTVRDTNVSPTMAKKLCCVIPSLTDRAMNAARTEDSDFVQALLEFLKDHDVLDGSSQGSLMSVAAQAGNLQVVRALLDRAAAAAVAGGVAFSLYLDAKYHLSKDINSLRGRRTVVSAIENAVKTDRVSPYYIFEQAVQKHPYDEAIWTRNGSVSWKTTYDRVNQYAQLFLSYGVKPGQFVAFFMQNSPDFAFAWVGLLAIGAAPAMINYNLTGKALLGCIEISTAKLVLVDGSAEVAAKYQDVNTELDMKGIKLINLAEEKPRVYQMDPVRPHDNLRKGMMPGDAMALFYTSGTTGLPKAVLFPAAAAASLSLQASTDETGFNDLGFHPTAGNSERCYICMPYYHGTGGITMMSQILSGSTVCMAPKFSVSTFWDDIRDSNATWFVYVGETLRYLLAAPPSPRDKEHNIHAVFGNGCRPDVWRRFQERFGVDTVCEFYNSTEGALGLRNLSRGDFFANAVGHHGLLLRLKYRNMYVPVAIDTETGEVQRDPKTGLAIRMSYETGGEILVEHPGERAFPGYFNNPDATDKKYVRDVLKKGDIFYRTGDSLRRDADGRWFFLDRLGDTYRWKGENVSTAEVSEVLGEYPGVNEAVVYGVSLPGHDGKAGAAALDIAPDKKASFDFADFLRYSRSRLPRYAVPIFVRLLNASQASHNNKQNKVPLKNQGVNPSKIEGGDQLLWIEKHGKGNTYVPFTQDDWDNLGQGRAKL